MILLSSNEIRKMRMKIVKDSNIECTLENVLVLQGRGSLWHLVLESLRLVKNIWNGFGHVAASLNPWLVLYN
jgi:hypothetical protein